ncbi:MAG TPA: endo-1,4-beta-xylanase [Thermoguttaceae bacterium]|nr:endo-1,4-beta-xylanase [Thermoguttaceae bacterium]
MTSFKRIATLTVALTLLAVTASAAIVIEAEDAAVRTEGVALHNGIWNLHSAGRVGQYLRTANEGSYRIDVRAYGSPAAGQWPEMALMVDGERLATLVIDRPDAADYHFTGRLPAGVCEVAVAFLNDGVVDGEDRNLYVDRIAIRPPAGLADPVLVDAEQLAERFEREEQETLRLCRDRIEKNRKANATVRVVDAKGQPVVGASVELEQTDHDFLFGCNIYRFDRFKNEADNAAYKRRFEELFNYATTGFYWKSYEWERGKPSYAYTDAVVAWCEQRGIRLKGHPLLWGHEAGIPHWSDGQPEPSVQRQRVVDIMTRYHGKIDFWEVVNEPSHVREPKIDEPYRWARAADPSAYLIVNDYYVMADGYPPFFELLSKARADGVPFDGIGIQAHEPRTMRFPLDRVWRTLDQYATLGKELHITEFSPASGGKPIAGSHRTGNWDEAAQADYAAKFYQVCFAHPAVRGITWWDLCDNGSWLEGGGMLRADLSPKPVYNELKRLIHEEWNTRATGKTDAQGNFAFRGFHGTYRFRASVQGRDVQGELHIGRDAANSATVVLR